MQAPTHAHDRRSRPFGAPGPTGHPPTSRAKRSRRGAAQGCEPEANPSTSPAAARSAGPGGAPTQPASVDPTASQALSGASAAGRLPFGSHRGTSEHPGARKRTQRVNPYTAESREERKEARSRIAMAEERAGARKAAANLRGCEFSTWGVTPASGNVAVSLKDGRPVREVMHCDHRLCPCCSRRRATRLKDRLRPVISATFQCRAPRLVTLTQDDRPGEPLASAFRRLMTAFRKLRRLKRWTANVRGGVVSMEVTRNKAAGHWHAHLHLLIDADWYEQEDLLADWRSALGTTGMRIGGARIEEAGRINGVAVPDQLGAGVDEVVKYVGKGIEIAREWSDEDLLELVRWMRGKRLLRTFGSIYNVTIDDEETPTVDVEGDGEEFYDPITGEVATRAELRWSADARAQQAGWRVLADRWASPPRQEPEGSP